MFVHRVRIDCLDVLVTHIVIYRLASFALLLHIAPYVLH
jgi:hypothetical protein